MTSSKLPLQRKIQEILMRLQFRQVYFQQNFKSILFKSKIAFQNWPSASATSILAASSFDTPPATRQLSVGGRILAKWYPSTGKPTWRLGMVAQKLGKLHCIITLDENGYSKKIHINQLSFVAVGTSPKKTVKFFCISKHSALFMNARDPLQK